MKRKNILVMFFVVFTILLSSFSFYTYQVFFWPNLLVDKDDTFLLIHKGTTFKMLQKQLDEERIVNDLVSFSLIAKLKNYNENIKAGRYLLKEDMSNLEAVRLLQSGHQTPVQLTFQHARKLSGLTPIIASQLALSTPDFEEALQSSEMARQYGFDEKNFISMFIPNTYEVYWTVSIDDLLNRLKSEYDKFWNEDRREKAKNINLSIQEVSTLASIVQGETQKMDEAPMIAEVYLNRLRKSMLLQADPTLVFAKGDFEVRRVLHKDKKIDSPYNTYKYKGLPPGPINMPSILAVDAVLNTESHDYLYFCAKEDFSGYHVFAKTYAQHLKNARKFHQSLNKEKIYR